MTLPPSTANVPHAGFALFYGTGAFAGASAAEDAMCAGFKADAGYCLDAPDGMPSGATRILVGDVMTTVWRRPWFRPRDLPRAPAAPASDPDPVPPSRLERRLQKPGAFEQQASLAGDLALLLASAASRVELANKEGDPILSAWLPAAQQAIAKARAAGLL